MATSAIACSSRNAAVASRRAGAYHGDMKRVAITPHSDYEPAVQATKGTLAMLPMSPVVNMAEALDEQGRIVGETINPDFVRFACQQQGYAKSVEILD
jgi:hypothetical protein